MKLTYKAIARSAGYHIKSDNMGYYWVDALDTSRNDGWMRLDTAAEAWRVCCVECDLIEEEYLCL